MQQPGAIARKVLSASAVVAGALALASCGGNDDTGGIVSGAGYSFELPSDWHDSAEIKNDLGAELNEELPGDLGIEIDAAAIAPPVNGLSSNVNVLVEPSLALTIDARDYASLSMRPLKNARLGERLLGDTMEVVGPPTSLESLSVDGKEAFGSDYTSEQGGRRLRQRFVGTVQDGTGYAITFTALEDAFEGEVEQLESILESWRWE